MERSTLNAHLKRRYGITIDDYDAMYEAQGGVCAVCGKQETRSTRSSKRVWERDIKPRLVVDHNHNTGAVRGLLGHRCNVGIGQLNDSPDMLLKALRYLRRYE